VGKNKIIFFLIKRIEKYLYAFLTYNIYKISKGELKMADRYIVTEDGFKVGPYGEIASAEDLEKLREELESHINDVVPT